MIHLPGSCEDKLRLFSSLSRGPDAERPTEQGTMPILAVDSAPRQVRMGTAGHRETLGLLGERASSKP